MKRIESTRDTHPGTRNHAGYIRDSTGKQEVPTETEGTLHRPKSKKAGPQRHTVWEDPRDHETAVPTTPTILGATHRGNKEDLRASNKNKMPREEKERESPPRKKGTTIEPRIESVLGPSDIEHAGGHRKYAHREGENTKRNKKKGCWERQTMLGHNPCLWEKEIFTFETRLWCTHPREEESDKQKKTRDYRRDLYNYWLVQQQNMEKAHGVNNQRGSRWFDNGRRM